MMHEKASAVSTARAAVAYMRMGKRLAAASLLSAAYFYTEATGYAEVADVAYARAVEDIEAMGYEVRLVTSLAGEVRYLVIEAA